MKWVIIYHYRNLVPIDDIDTGALWRTDKEKGMLTLVDDDEFKQVKWEKGKFEEVISPEFAKNFPAI